MKQTDMMISVSSSRCTNQKHAMYIVAAASDAHRNIHITQKIRVYIVHLLESFVLDII
jgi:hypothetical protein